MGDGIGFNWYRKYMQRPGNFPPAQQWLEIYTAKYSMLRRKLQ